MAFRPRCEIILCLESSAARGLHSLGHGLHYHWYVHAYILYYYTYLTFIHFKYLSCICTDKEPDQNVMRCVPQAWCVKSKVSPMKIWDDSGAGGGKPGSIWTINSMDMVCFVAGHEPPTEPGYELKSMRFFMGQFSRLNEDSTMRFS